MIQLSSVPLNSKSTELLQITFVLRFAQGRSVGRLEMVVLFETKVALLHRGLVKHHFWQGKE